MKVNPYSFNSISEKKVSFGQKGRHEPNRLLTEQTMKVFSAAISSMGIAGIELRQYTHDYARVFDKEITRSELDNVGADVIAEAMECTPLLIETILTDRSASGRTRTLTDESLKSLIDTYSIDPELTEQLLLEKDDKGNYKFMSSQIAKLVSINKEYPELLPIAKESLNFVDRLLQMVNSSKQPLYGIEDIKKCHEILKINNNYTLNLMQQKDERGYARFTPKQIKYFVKKCDMEDEFLVSLLDAKHPLMPNRYRFKPEQIIELTKIAKNQKEQKLLADLMKVCGKIYSFGDEAYLSSVTIVDIMKNQDASLYELIGKHAVHEKLALQIYALLNGKIETDELEEILSIKNRAGYRLFPPEYLLKHPNLFTKEANKQIKKRILSEW